MRHAFLLVLIVTGCTRLGNLGGGLGKVLEEDRARLLPGDPAAPGPFTVEARGTVVGEFGDGIPIVLYQPANAHGPLPGLVFLPARAAPEWQYESYGRALASRGFVVAVRGWYGFLRTDPELAEDARKIGAWLVERGYVERTQLGIGGHSMGGKASIMAALADQIFRAVVAIDPDENGYTHVARGPIAKLRAPLLVIGAEDAIKGWKICATPEGNYRSFFRLAPPGTVELALRHTDHVQFMDKPDELGMGICRRGSADSRAVRALTRAALVRFIDHTLRGLPLEAAPPDPLARWRVKEAPTSTATR